MALTRICIFSRIPDMAKHVSSSIPASISNKVQINTIDSSKSDANLTSNQLSELQGAQVLLTDPALLTEHQLIYNLPNLDWLMSTWAGVDAVFKSLDSTKPLPSYKLSRFGGYFGRHMAEYVAGQIIAYERGFRSMDEDKKEKKWETAMTHPYRQYRLLSQLTIGILGLGDIGKEVAQTCKNFGMKVNGMVRRPITDENRSRDVDKYWMVNELPQLLAECDYICSVLPSTSETRGLLAGSVLSNCSKKPVLINLGRGDVIPEADVIQALDEGWISHAILDVFEKEPLPERSPLWEHPKITISPHVSAISFGWQVAELFGRNLEKYLDGKQVDFVVDWMSGY